MYYVAIPSYQRENIILEKTLSTLRKGNVPNDYIYIFVASKKEYDNYKNVLGNTYKIIIGVKGIKNQRNFIRHYFKKGDYVVSIDDDIEEVNKLNGDKLVVMHDLNKFFIHSFELLKKYGLYIWGIYPVRNPFFMKKNISTNLKFIIGTLYGFIVRHDHDLNVHVKEKEDYEQSILYYIKDGGILRFNHITMKTKFKSIGGLGTIEKRYDANEKAALYLQKKYPQFVSIFERNNMKEIRLRHTI